MYKHRLAGVWRASGVRIDILWNFPPDSPSWIYDSEEEILSLGRIDAPDERYLVRWISADQMMLVRIPGYRVTSLTRVL